MTPRTLGIDISDIHTTLVYYGEDKTYQYRTIICKEKNSDKWFVGEDAYARVLDGTGTMSDKLLTMTQKEHFTTMDGQRYYGKELMQMYLSILIEKSMQKSGRIYPEKIVISIPEIVVSLVEMLSECLMNLGYLRSNIAVISRTESFIYYTVSKTKDIWNNQVALFEFSDKNMRYYEMKVQKLPRNTIVYAESVSLEAAVHSDMVATEAGAKLVDTVLAAGAREKMQKKVFSSVILTGRGFRDAAWAQDFLRFICDRRKVFYDEEVFARGAAVKALELASDKPYPITCICDGHLDTGVSLNLERENKPFSYSLAKAGDVWYKAKNELRLLPDGVAELELVLSPVEQKRTKIIRIGLEFLGDRPNKTRRIDLKTSFKDNKTLLIDIQDAGFGDFYKKTDARLVKEVGLWD